MGEAESGAVELEAAVFRRLVAHLQSHTEVQNIDLMNLAGFCRNCLSKWYVEAAAERGLVVDAGAARERVYGMPYEEWKSKYQKPCACPHAAQGSDAAVAGESPRPPKTEVTE